MPDYDLAAIAAQQGIGTDLTLNPIGPTQALENELAAVYVAPVRSEADRLRTNVLPVYAMGNQDALKGAVYADQSSMDRDTAIAAVSILPFLRKVEVWQVTRWGQAIKSAVGVDLKPMLLSADAAQAVDAAGERATAALNGGMQDFRRRVDTILWQGVAQGKTRLQVTDELKDALAIGTRRARNNGIDQTQYTVGDLNRLRQTQAGITEYMWRHTAQPRPRFWHKARDGKVYSWSDPPYDGPPATLPNCKCAAQGIVRPDATRH